jgi:hypothetical protein
VGRQGNDAALREQRQRQAEQRRSEQKPSDDRRLIQTKQKRAGHDQRSGDRLDAAVERERDVPED